MDFLEKFVSIALNRLTSGDTSHTTDKKGLKLRAQKENRKYKSVANKTGSDYKWLGGLATGKK